MNANTAKVAIVTGASSGIGMETARKLHGVGFIVYGVARRVDRMEDLERLGIKVLGMDVTDETSVAEGVATVLKQEGRIDLLVNNAGYGSYGAFEEVPLSEARRQFDVNVFGLAQLTQLVLPSMREQRSGTIINISSIGGKITSPLGSWYHASKFAVEGLSDALRLELAPFGIDVVVVEPGAIATEWGGIALESAVAVSGEGPYAPVVKAANRAMASLERPGRASPPSVIAEAIARAATAKRPKTRYVAGSGARAILFARRVLSDRMLDTVMSSLFRLPRRL